MQGKVELPRINNLLVTLRDLLFGTNSKSKNFQDNIIDYNMMFSFTLKASNIQKNVNQGRGLYVYRMHGQNYIT